MKNTVIYKSWFVFVFAAAILIAIAVLSFDGNCTLSIIIIIIGILLIGGCILAMPIACKINETGITVYYCFRSTSAEWKDLKYIKTQYSHPLCIGFSDFDYNIGFFKAKSPFFKDASVPGTRKTTKLLKKYSKIPID